MKQLHQILAYELGAISKTICDYTTDNFIRSYATQLLDLKLPQDYEGFQFIVNQLVEWYSEEMEKIITSPYSSGRISHQKSFHILQLLKTYFEDRPMK